MCPDRLRSAININDWYPDALRCTINTNNISRCNEMYYPYK